MISFQRSLIQITISIGYSIMILLIPDTVSAQNIRPIFTKGVNLTNTQKENLSKAQYWKVNVSHNYGDAKEYGGVKIEEDIKKLFDYSGWKIVPPNSPTYDFLFDIDVNGRPGGCTYHLKSFNRVQPGQTVQVTSFHYTSAEIKINAAIMGSNNPLKIEFNPTSGIERCIRGQINSKRFLTPESAPFHKAYLLNDKFFEQLFWLIYQSKGTEALSSAMKDTFFHESIRRYMIEVAGETKDMLFSDSLIYNLNSKDSGVRRYSVESLENLKDKKAVPWLSKVLEEDQDEWVRCRAARALGRIGGENAVDILNKSLRSQKSDRVRDSIIDALKRSR
jgi:hypothetical protein